MEKELEMQISMRQEMELAMKMLEKDVCEKQDALVSLRQQLDDLRALKHELAFKLQVGPRRGTLTGSLNSQGSLRPSGLSGITLDIQEGRLMSHLEAGGQ